MAKTGSVASAAACCLRRRRRKRSCLIGLSLLCITTFSLLHAVSAFTNNKKQMTPAATTTVKTMMNSSSAAAATAPPKIAIIGAGAAGLAAARVFSRNGLAPIVLEKEPCVGGVWKYNDNEQRQQKTTTTTQQTAGPMYRGLRTNLPKEVMRYREFPFRSTLSASYVSHRDVLEYLEDYKNEFSLSDYISYNSHVTSVRLVKDSVSRFSPPTKTKTDNSEEDEDGDNQPWPQIRVEWDSYDENENDDETTKRCRRHEDTFDAVCVCNGHYAKPSTPYIPGSERFGGEIVHSMEYDDPADFRDATVLCIGARASGSDLAREIGAHAHRVYLSDSTNTDPQPQTLGNITWVPRTIEIKEDGSVVFDNNCVASPQVDVIIFCTGYDYSFPFLLQQQQQGQETNGEDTTKTGNENEDDNSPLLTFVPGERRVTPLYQQLWHAKYPTLAFVGLPHSVVPFPLFEFQAEALYSQWTTMIPNNNDGSTTTTNNGNDDGDQPLLLPPYRERIRAARADATSGGPKRDNTDGRVQDTHFLGSFQWDYCRQLAKLAGNYNENTESFISTNKALYDQAGRERKNLFPGGPDTYRETCFERDDEHRSYRITRSRLTPVTTAAN